MKSVPDFLAEQWGAEKWEMNPGSFLAKLAT